MRKYISFIITALMLFVLSGTLSQAQIFRNQTLTTIQGGPLSTAKGGMGTTSPSTFINSAMSASGHAGQVWGNNGTVGGWVAATDPGCTGCVTTEAGDIAGVTIAADAVEATAGNDNDDGVAIKNFINANPTSHVLHFTPGVYQFRTSVAVNNNSDIEIKCDPGAIFTKDTAMDDDFNEYFFQFQYGSNIKIDGCKFSGLTTNLNTVNAGEQGIACFSCNGFRFLDNWVENIGDAGVRSTTSPGDSLNANSFNTWITNNTFYNVSQITTTPASATANTKSGTSGIWVQHNKMLGQKWSTKMCTRGPSNGIYVSDNYIDMNTSSTLTSIGIAPGHATTTIAATGDGIEMCSVGNAFIEKNTIMNAPVAGITQYTNPGSALTHFDYGNYHIENNNIVNSQIGIRFANDVYGDGVCGTVRNIFIKNNILSQIWGTGGPRSIIVTGACGITNGLVSENIMDRPASGSYMSLPASGVTSAGNIQN